MVAGSRNEPAAAGPGGGPARPRSQVPRDVTPYPTIRVGTPGRRKPSSGSICIRTDDLSPGAGDQGLEHERADGILDEPDRAVGEPAIEAAGVNRAGAVERGLGLLVER